MAAKKRTSDDFSFHPFENLREIIESKRVAVAGRPSEEKKKSPSDDELFCAAMKEVREIEEFRQIPVRPNKVVSKCSRNSRRYNELCMLEEVVQGRVPINLPDTQEYVEWVNPAYWPARNGKISEKLHSGAFSVQDSLDLHGLILEEAEEAIERFLKDALVKGLWCIKIIHGRGLRSPDGPVLKSSLVAWLRNRYRKNVIAFASARQCDGGLGALYVLLTK